jgi:putative intracellular protease/amidase
MELREDRAETRTVHVAVYDGWADWEVGHATAHLRNGAWQSGAVRYTIATVGPTRAPVTTMGGLRVTPDLALGELDPAASALLILPGSGGWDAGAQETGAQETNTGELAAFAAAARRFLDAGVPVAAICGAVAGLAREGLLDERDHTGAAPEYLAATGYRGTHRYREAGAHTDRGLITAGPTHPVEFARAIFALLGLYTPQVLDAWYRLFATGESAAFHELMAAGRG